jgi:hypothetical protein
MQSIPLFNLPLPSLPLPFFFSPQPGMAKHSDTWRKHFWTRIPEFEQISPLSLLGYIRRMELYSDDLITSQMRPAIDRSVNST